MGIGTSVLLKMNTEKALGELGIDAEVEAADIGVAKGAAATADLVLTSEELVAEIGDVETPIVVINSFFDMAEITEKLRQATA